MLIAAPEMLVLVMACVVLCVDTFLGENRRGIIHMLGMLTVVFAAIIISGEKSGPAARR